MKERGKLPNEEGDAVREYKAMHEENFWSSWLREDKRGKEERMAKAEKNEGEKGEKRKREVEKEENQMVGLSSVEAFEIFSQEGDVASRRRWLESQGVTVHGKKVGKTSGMTVSIKELWHKPPPSQQSSSSTRAEEG